MAIERSNILVVEDAYLVGMQLKQDLESLGYTVAGPASSVSDACDLIDRHRVHLAVLDVNLGHENSIPVAERLLKEGVPFLFITGYATAEADTDIFDKQVLLRKPVLLDQLQEALHELAK